MRQDDRAPFLAALERARRVAYPHGEYVGQESFMSASEIRGLARRAGVGPGTSVLDLCCGIGGPGRLLTAETGCRYLGLDSSASAIDIAARLAGDLPCRFERAAVPPLPQGRFDVVLLLETMLAFPDKASLVTDVARGLRPGGRFAFTVEEGLPLTPAERALMPDSDTVWPIEEPALRALLEESGLVVTWQEERTEAHAARAAALLRSFRADSDSIVRGIGTQAAAELITAHQLWSEWLGRGRIRKLALVAERR